MDQESENAFRLNLLAYMNIFLVANMEYLKLHEPSMLGKDEASSNQILSSLDDLVHNTMDELKDDSIL